MKPYPPIQKALLVLFSITLGCSGNGEWTSEEKQEIKHLKKALDENREALEIFDKVASPADLSEKDLKKILSRKQRALAEAKLVSEAVLEKIHPEMASRFRSQFQRGLDLYIQGTSTRNLLAQKQARDLDDAWRAWHDMHDEEMKLP